MMLVRPVFIVLVLCASGCQSRDSLGHFRERCSEIKQGQKFEHVVQLLGRGGKQIPFQEVPTRPSYDQNVPPIPVVELGERYYRWDHSSGGAYIVVSISNGTVVRRGHSQPNVDLSFIKRSGESNADAGDQYTGLDRFGRVVDHRWVLASNGTACAA